MKRATKIIFSLILVILFLVTCFAMFVIFAFSSWLHTYRVFTQKTLVAEITVSEAMQDEDGYEYMEVEYKPVKESSALTRIFSSRSSDEDYDEVQKYKLYGDHFEIGGEIVKFDDFWLLLNLENIYKVTRLEGDYTDRDTALEVAENGDRSIVELNGGTDEYWKTLQENEGRYEFLVDSVYGNFATKFVQKESRTYNLYITEDGFILDEK